MGNVSKPTTLSYFVKRLRDSGYVVDELYTNYGEMDARRWTVVIDPGCASVFCTCIENKHELGEKYFEYWDGGQFFNSNKKFMTSSIEVLIEHLVDCGVNNKAPGYGSQERTIFDELAEEQQGRSK